MKKAVILLLLCAIFCGVSGCARTKKLMFWKKGEQESPAFVDEKNPLAVPPEYSLRPAVVKEPSTKE